MARFYRTAFNSHRRNVMETRVPGIQDDLLYASPLLNKTWPPIKLDKILDSVPLLIPTMPCHM